MKNSLWAINSTLCIFILLMVVALFFSYTPVPNKTSLIPTSIPPLSKDVSKINLARIYESDLFNTFVRQPPAPTFQEPELLLPQPPQDVPVARYERAVPQFLQPLDVALKGVIFMNDDSQNRIIIADNKTKQESLMKIGDKVQDAVLLTIGSKKAIFLRSNGQQETLFISPAQAQKDPIFAPLAKWGSAVKQLDSTTFAIDVQEFIKQVPSVAQFIDILDITTAFDKGKNIGCRVGIIRPNSLGNALGLQTADIIQKIQDIPTTTTNNRVAIYKMVQSLENNALVHVTLVRNGKLLTHTYQIIHSLPTSIPAPAEDTTTKTTEIIKPLQQEELAQRQDSTEKNLESLERAIQASTEGIKAAPSASMRKGAVINRPPSS